MTAHGDTLVTLDRVGVCYHRRARFGLSRPRQLWALHDISFELFKGEVLGVIGRNGAGKTSLLRLLAGILRPDRGQVTRHAEFRASMQTAQVRVVNALTGRENAILSGLLLGMSLRELHEKMDEIVAYAELEEFIDEPVSIYSRGMKARLGFSVAYHADPDVILLDESLGAGDAAFRKKSAESMKERLRSERTVVLVSHDTSTLREMCDRAVLIEKGETIASGATEEVLERYAQLGKGTDSQPQP